MSPKRNLASTGYRDDHPDPACSSIRTGNDRHLLRPQGDPLLQLFPEWGFGCTQPGGSGGCGACRPGSLAGIFSVVSFIFALRTSIRSVQIFGSLAFLTVILAAITGLLFTLSGFQMDGYTEGMATNFLLTFSFYFMELYFMKPAPKILQGVRILPSSRLGQYSYTKMTALKTILFMLLVPGLLVGVLPIWLVHSDPALLSFGGFRWLAIPLWVGGAAVMLWCAWAFTVRGEGTPSPTDSPKKLVVSGLYRYVRNPIYLGVLAVFAGYVLWHPSPAILLCPLIVAISSHLFVTLYEEPHLRKTFGAEYDEYFKAVPRWIPRFPGK